MKTDGSELRILADLNPVIRSTNRNGTYRYPSTNGFHADLSPDGSQMVHSTCEYQVVDKGDALRHRYQYTLGRWRQDIALPALRGEAPATILSYELRLLDMDTMEPTRLTADNWVDHYPTWSPDGRNIAFLTTDYAGDGREETRDEFKPSTIHLSILSVEDPESPTTVHHSARPGVGLFPPVWSPNGQYLAVVKKDEAGHDIQVTKVHGSNLETNTFGYTTVAPTWSPDSKRLAFAGNRKVYIADADGANLKHITTERYPVTAIDWHPEEPEILVVAYGMRTITPEGDEVRQLVFGNNAPQLFDIAAWSHDGKRIAARASWLPEEEPEWKPDGSIADVRSVQATASWDFNVYLVDTFDLISMARDGTDVQSLATTESTHEWERDPGIPYIPTPPRPPVTPEGIHLCTDARVMIGGNNEGLIQDCEALHVLRDHLMADPPVNWNIAHRITEWEGLHLERIDGNLRVTAVTLRNRGLRGSIPPEIGDLSELRGLGLYSKGIIGRDALTGTIPEEIGNLTKLRGLGLTGHYITGSIPESLNDLKDFGSLNIRCTLVSGCVSEKLARVIQITNQGSGAQAPEEHTAQQATESVGLTICPTGEEQTP